MNKENQNAERQESNKTDAATQKPINPFDKSQVTSADREKLEEDAAAEQQRKEALTERD